MLLPNPTAGDDGSTTTEPNYDRRNVEQRDQKRGGTTVTQGGANVTVCSQTEGRRRVHCDQLWLLVDSQHFGNWKHYSSTDVILAIGVQSLYTLGVSRMVKSLEATMQGRSR